MKTSGIYEKLAAELKSDDGKKYKPISSSRKPALQLGIFGVSLGVLVILAGVCIWAGQGITSLMSHFAAPTAESLKKADSDMLKQCDTLIKKGELAKAQALLESTEDKIGLTVEQSDKLDSVYLAIAKKFAADGKRVDAVEVLTRIPHESKLYKQAQSTIKHLNSKEYVAKKSHQKKMHIASSTHAKGAHHAKKHHR